MTIDRRAFLALLGASVASIAARTAALADQFQGTVPLAGPDAAPLDRVLGTGLDARLFTDLSALTADSLVVPSDRFFVRTACPAAARNQASWWIKVDGLVRSPLEIPIETLRAAVRPMDTVLFECSGNSDPNNFGLIGAAGWEGAPVAVVFDRAERLPAATRVLIAGVDDPDSPQQTSYPGASWIFTLDELVRAGAFFATAMNGAGLAPDHGAPVRLVVPGWYGCACIKWVNQITFVDEDAPATTQMREFSARTHQNGMPALARDYIPATIDHAAMPVRVEKWSADGRVFYKVVGIQWGGERPIDRLLIRIGPVGAGGTDAPFVPVEDCPMPATTATWSLWTHTWRPAVPGRYAIELKAADPAIRTRRLDSAYYRRFVSISD
jgi:DMSO/TMAO reductase YedYZ molybdopterin-dependent catalytic subunit